MLRVIDLDIEGTLTGDTRVAEIAMVEMPAIEQDFIYFEKQEFESYNDYPQAATTNACRAVKWAEENGWGSCLQAEGKNRANQLCNRENITEETIARMSAFRRHQQHKDVPYSEGCGGIAWDAWGGDAGVDWAQRKLEQIRKSKEEMDVDVSNLPPYNSYPTGDTKSDMLIEPVLFVAGDKVSFDYDETLNTLRGRLLAEREIRSGSEVYIISARADKSRMLKLADELNIPHDKVFATGSNNYKIQKVKDLRIDRHYDNNKDVIKELGRVGEQFEGNDSDYSDEDFEVKCLLSELKRTDFEKFEAIVGEMRGRTEDEVKKLNHKKPTNYFKYERVLDGSPDRDFCMSIEDRYFRRVEIDMLKDTNIDFGHEGQPYSKWLYKGGPNCVHAWKKFIAQGNVLSDQGMALGLAGTPPKQMPNNGYYMSKLDFKADTEKRMVYSPLMIPNILIPRLDEVTNEKYYVKFTPQVIEKIQNLYMIEKRLDQTNYEHTEQKMLDVVMVESWLVSGNSDKSFELGFNRENIPDGTWMGGFKVLDTPEGDNIWNNFIKTGKVKGFSVEGNFITNFSRVKNDEYLLQEIINIIKRIND